MQLAVVAAQSTDTAALREIICAGEALRITKEIRALGPMETLEIEITIMVR